MAIIKIMWHPIWPYLEEHVSFLRNQRKLLPLKDRTTRIGINISLILMSAFCVEGKIEYELKELIKHRLSVMRKIGVDKFYERRIFNTFMNNIEDYLNSRIERTTGVDNFGSFLELLSHKRTPAKFSDYPNWEGMRVLFNFRNVLAHARETSARRTSAWWFEGDWRDEFSGGYKLAEDYLLKKMQINGRFIEKGSVEHLFTNKVADHFLSLSKSFTKYISKLIAQEKRLFNHSNIKEI